MMSLQAVPGTTMSFAAYMPGWDFQLAHDGRRTYGVWSLKGRNILAVVAGDA